VCVVGLLLYFLNSHSRLVSMANVAQYGITATHLHRGHCAMVIGISAHPVFNLPQNGRLHIPG
jgi:alpha-L-arabinofuranosidase